METMAVIKFRPLKTSPVVTCGCTPFNVRDIGRRVRSFFRRFRTSKNAVKSDNTKVSKWMDLDLGDEDTWSITSDEKMFLIVSLACEAVQRKKDEGKEE